MEASHVSVLFEESMSAMTVHPGGRYIDCTLGAGGHAEGILERSAPDGLLLGLDADPKAIEIAAARLARFGQRAILVNENFFRLREVAERLGYVGVDGVLFDLGFSSVQLSDADRGLSFMVDGPLDMRLDPREPETAADLLNSLSEAELAGLLWRFGEEPGSRRIARLIVQERAKRPLASTRQLAALVERAVGGRHGEKIHPATRTFQALRIAVNHELERLSLALEQALDLLATGGRLVVIAFHSLEDRIVKRFMEVEAKGCICPPESPVCTCSHKPRLRRVSKGVLKPGPDEVAANPRARSARLRVAERIELWQ
ncbi:MAG: 16S rRNA (cytosine(1402)-N(4))-methyltransferase RsmH [Chloroflexi bacterium]|nr:16S rRNA (cytosine(1402)-N(4))-methyltransferase RsmH [Chloroflexota bacterium]